MEPVEIVALVLVIFFVISVNVGLIRAARGKIAFPEIALFRRVAQQAKDPWKSQNEDLQELARRVSNLKNRHEENRPDQGPDKEQ